MGNQLITPVWASKLACELGIRLKGKDKLIKQVLPSTDAVDGALCFLKAKTQASPSFEAVVIAPQGICSVGTLLESDNPRLTFAQALNWIKVFSGFKLPSERPFIHPEAKVSPQAIIGNGATIGKNTIIQHFVVVGENVRIGDGCIIKSGSIIGEEGFGFERDEKGIPIRIPQLGSVIIGNKVEIGSLNTICRGSLLNTVIEDNVKTDDHVHIAHNCHIGEGALITACAELSGGVKVGKFCWVGPNSSVIQKAVLGKSSFVGIGSNVTKDVPAHETVAGNPARILRKFEA